MQNNLFKTIGLNQSVQHTNVLPGNERKLESSSQQKNQVLPPSQVFSSRHRIPAGLVSGG
jgi:hypothetical protein